MRVILAIILLCALALPADAARRKRRPAKRRAVAARPCPPPIVRVLPDRVEVISQAEQDAADSRRAQSRHNFERDFAEWLARQPNMSPAAASVLRETARQWYGRGRGERIDN